MSRRQHDRQRAFEDIFARPSAAPAVSSSRPGPPAGLVQQQQQQQQTLPPMAPQYHHQQAYAQYYDPYPARPQSAVYPNAYPYPQQQQQQQQQYLAAGGGGGTGPRYASPAPSGYAAPYANAYSSAYHQPAPPSPKPGMMASSSSYASPHPAQLATDYIFQQQQEQQQQYQQPSSYAGSSPYSPDNLTEFGASSAPQASPSGSGAVEPVDELMKDPHLSAYMVRPREGDTLSSAVAAAGATTPALAPAGIASIDDFGSLIGDAATTTSKSSGHGSFDGFAQSNPAMRDPFYDQDGDQTPDSGSIFGGRAYAPSLSQRHSNESDRFPGAAHYIGQPSGPRPLPPSKNALAGAGAGGSLSNSTANHSSASIAPSPGKFRPYNSVSAAASTSGAGPYNFFEGGAANGSNTGHSPYPASFVSSSPHLARTSVESFHAPPTPSQQPPGMSSSRASYRPSIYNINTAAASSAPGYDRTLSMTSTSPTQVNNPRASMALPASTTVVTHSRRSPIVYPALLSRVAEAFKARIQLGEHVKDGLLYKDTFNGREAVDKICYIIKTTDRNLALLLGRALDAQKFFHDVAWEHRLRDSPNEVYQFRERMAFVASDGVHEGALLDRHQSGMSLASTVGDGLSLDMSHKMLLEDPQRPGVQAQQQDPQVIQQQQQAAENQVPSGIFTLLTDCYSPTCSRDRLCYSIACPRRLEQQARLKLKPQPGLRRTHSTVSLGDLKEPSTLWVHRVPQEVADSVDKRERDRQEAINEVISTERDFLRDVEYLRDTWIQRIRDSNCIPEDRREDFITQVFWNILDIHAVSQRLVEALHLRQKAALIVHEIGDVLLDHVGNFQPFVRYGSHQIFGKYEFEREKGSNPAFAQFVEETERLPESRKLELNGYLTKPTTRLARYPLLLETVLKKTPEEHPDQTNLPKAVKVIREFLSTVNAESGRSENRFNLAQLDTQLIFRPGEAVDLKLREENRELIFKGPLKKRGGTQNESAELQVFLFDHAILITKPKSKNEQYKVFRKPIPLELLIVTVIEENGSTSRLGSGRARALVNRNSSASKSGNTSTPAAPQSKNGFAMNLAHLGRKGYDITLWAPTWASRKNWLEKIETRQMELRERSLVFDTGLLSEGIFTGPNKVTCAAPYDGGQRLVIGTETGVFLADLNHPKKLPLKVVAVNNVTQVEVLDDHGLLIVLADRAVQTFFIDGLDPRDAIGAAKRSRKITSNTTFFKSGVCMGRTLVCVVKTSSASSTIKTLEPTDHGKGRKQPGIRKFLQGSHEHFRVYKEFYLPIPTDSIHFLKSKLCVGCPKGFEIVDLQTLNTQGLLDPADASLDFVQRRENVKPIAIYRIDSEFLLCYDEFAFFVNKNGWRTKGHWLVQWEGRPSHFALHYPFVLAFEGSFIEVRHVDTGALMQIIPGSGLRCLYDDSPVASSVSSAAHFGHGYGGYPNAGVHPNMARQSVYGGFPAQLPRPSQSASQIICLDNGHQILRIQPAPPP